MSNIDFVHYYPAWLGDALVRGSLPWDQGLSVLMPRFLHEYTLHDSVWEGLWVEPAFGEATAVIRWDSFWSEGRIPYPEGEYDLEGGWPLLLIRFQHVYQVLATQTTFAEPQEFPDVIMEAHSKHIPQDEREGLLTEGLRQPFSTDDSLLYLLDDTLYETQIVGLPNQRKTRMLHGGPVLLLSFNPAGELIPIPGLG
jgi:hypothetical protein